MSAKDIYHNLVKDELSRLGWHVTHDPFVIRRDPQLFQIDLGAERLIAAERGTRKIAVEVKSFLSNSAITDFYAALGQFLIYKKALYEIEPDRQLYLAMPADTYRALFSVQRVGELIEADYNLKVMLYDTNSQEITEWIPQP